MLYKENEIIEKCENENIQIHDMVLDTEISLTKRSREDILSDLHEILNVMKRSSTLHLEEESSTTMNLIQGFSKKMLNYSKSNNTIGGEKLSKLMAMAFSTMETNASMGKIVAAPTAGSAGIIPAVIMYYNDNFDASDEELVNALLTATGIGHIVGKYGTFAGAEGGCQAECGAASAMGAAALVYLHGGTVRQIMSAASITIMNVLGLVCDPIGGIVEFPCGFRNASGATNALISADMAMAGLYSIVPFEQVVMAMNKVGKTLPATLRETGLGGIAGTNIGLDIRDRFFDSEM